MKHSVRMLSTQLGCDDGVIYPTTYHQGETYQIGDALLNDFVSLGAVELAPDTAVTGPQARETKVTGPEETKPAAKPLHKMSKAELCAHAVDLGLELSPDNMTAKQMIAAIEKAETKPAA